MTPTEPDPKAVPLIGWLLAPFLSLGIMLLIIGVVCFVVHGPFIFMGLAN